MYISWDTSTEKGREAMRKRRLEEQQYLHEAVVNFVRDSGQLTAVVGGPALGLSLTFDEIASADMLVGDSQNIDDWNNFFDLPNLGSPFTALRIIGAEVVLFGGEGIKVKPGLLYDYWFNDFLVKIIDSAGCITSVGGDAFPVCRGLLEVSLPECTILYGSEDSPYEGYGSFGECRLLERVNIPKLTTAGSYALAYCYSITELNFPNLTSAGDGCFDNCLAISSISLPNLLTAGEACFEGCISATRFSLPKLTTIGSYCFYGCAAAASFSLPLLTGVGMSVWVFKDCTAASSFDLPEITQLGYQTFFGCTAVTGFNFPKATSIGGYCFLGCTAATSFNLPLVTEVGSYAFLDCNSATIFNLPSCTQLGTTTGNDGVFYLNSYTPPKNISLTIPSALMTCNSGQPDGDIQYLQANHIVTPITV